MKKSKQAIEKEKKILSKKFEKLINKLKDKKPAHYTMSGSFDKNDIIDHDTFGRGVVIETSYKRIDVIFSDQSRTLVCDR